MIILIIFHSIKNKLTVIVHIPNDNVGSQFTKIPSQMSANSTSSASNQHNLSGNILKL